ncbi:unnamed protein product [Rotaria socialis]|uniref:Uncharacterized protein n=1 Tax=Rotaria socialis TaxID=392032 RepID=A0A820YY15_9BILA|nr:unnamed protein product [Rotaria socialis]CAF4556072.1 unnamed protein product [Rotaria socialis]
MTQFPDMTQYPDWEITGFPENSVISNYSSALTLSSERYPNQNKYYEAIEIIVNTTGTYSFRSSSQIDTMGYLYAGEFNPSNQNLNLLTQNDDYSTSNQFRLIAYLEAGVTYTLVVTTFGSDVRGAFTVIALGPSYVDFFPINVTDTTMIMPSVTETTSEGSVEFEQSTDYPENTQYPDWEITGFPENSILSYYSSALTLSSERYSNQNKYYEAIEVIVYITGSYSFTSTSNMDTFGYLYTGQFNPSNQNLNMLTYNDDSGSNQFRLIADLEAGVTYTLVVTTFGSDVRGAFTVIARGPTYVNFLPRNVADTTMIMSSETTTIATSTEAIVEFEQSTEYPNWEITGFPEGSISTSYSGALTLNSERNPNSGKYYKEISVIIYTTGVYSFTSSSSMDTFGYLFTGIFYPSDPSLNLITSNDDYPGSDQFRLIAYLEAGVSYKLVVTTFPIDTTGPFSITTLGPDRVSFLP